MRWPADHPALVDPELAPWAAAVDDVVPGARAISVLRYLPGRRVAALVEYRGELAVLKVFASPRARGNVRRLESLASTSAAALVPKIVGSDAAGHVLAVSYRRGALPASLSDSHYAERFDGVGRALRRLHDSGAELDRVWHWDREVAQLRGRAVPATREIVEALERSTSWLAGAGTVPAHRDFHPRQVVLPDDGSVALIDLDDAAMAPRALDVGNMLAHLRREQFTGARRPGVVNDAADAFLDGYGHAAEMDAGSVTCWTLLAVARLAALAESRHGDLGQRDALLAYCAGEAGGIRSMSSPASR